MRLHLIALVLFLPLSLSLPAFAETTLPEEKGCAQCHRFSAEEPIENRKAPDLFYAGDKLQAAWLEQFLIKPVVIRKAGFSGDSGFLKGKPSKAPHPSLSPKEAKSMSRHLLALKISDETAQKFEAAPLSKGQRVKAKILFERNFGCIACHEGINLAGKPRGGVSGPSLANAGSRLQGTWVLTWLKSPGTYLKKSRMPKFDIDDATALTLTRYILSLKAGEKNE